MKPAQNRSPANPKDARPSLARHPHHSSRARPSPSRQKPALRRQCGRWGPEKPHPARQDADLAQVPLRKAPLSLRSRRMPAGSGAHGPSSPSRTRSRAPRYSATIPLAARRPPPPHSNGSSIFSSVASLRVHGKTIRRTRVTLASFSVPHMWITQRNGRWPRGVSTFPLGKEKRHGLHPKSQEPRFSRHHHMLQGIVLCGFVGSDLQRSCLWR